MDNKQNNQVNLTEGKQRVSPSTAPAWLPGLPSLLCREGSPDANLVVSLSWAVAESLEKPEQLELVGKKIKEERFTES